MAIYYVNKNDQNNEDHELHKIVCSWLPEDENRLELGNFTSCYAALSEAKHRFEQVNGCAHCAPDCHTD